MRRLLIFWFCTILCLPIYARKTYRRASSHRSRANYAVNKSQRSKEQKNLRHPLTLADSIAYEATCHIGKPYRSGGKGPAAFDCSGFTSFVFKKFGFNLASNSREQYLQGVKISPENVRRGDLIFFGGHNGAGIGHVGIVFDVNPDNKTFRFIHSATSRGVTIDRYPDMGYFTRRFRGIRRIADFGNIPTKSDNTKVLSHPRPLPINVDIPDDSPAPTATASTSSSTTTTTTVTTYKIKKGDTLGRIAQRNKCSISDLMKWNGLKRNATLSVGKTLKIQHKAEVESVAQNVTASSSSKTIEELQKEALTNAHVTNKRVTVGADETIYSISQKYYCTVKEILEWNKLTNNQLAPGQEIVIRPTDNSNSDTLQNGQLTHTVLKGENIYQLSRLYNCSIDDIKTWNKLQSNVITPGAKIVILRIDKGNTHTAQPGETLNDISFKYGIPADKLVALNKLSTKQIRAGQIIKLSNDDAGFDTADKILAQHVRNVEPKAMPDSTLADTTAIADTNKTQASSSTSEQRPAIRETEVHYYKIRKGDTLEKIARMHNCKASDIKAWNNLRSNSLRVGKALIIKTESKAGQAQSKYINKDTNKTDSKTSPKQSEGPKFHTVVKGDNISKISRKYHVSQSEIIRLNSLKNVDALKIGQKIKIKQ